MSKKNILTVAMVILLPCIALSLDENYTPTQRAAGNIFTHANPWSTTFTDCRSGSSLYGFLAGINVGTSTAHTDSVAEQLEIKKAALVISNSANIDSDAAIAELLGIGRAVTATVVADGTATRTLMTAIGAVGTATAVAESQRIIDKLDAVLPAAVSGTVFQLFTTSITGAAWIDCRGADKVIFCIQYSLWNDAATVIGAGVTSYIDASNLPYDSLATLNSYPAWNMWIGRPADAVTPTIVSKTSDIIEVANPPNSLRWRLAGLFNATVSVYYKVLLRRK